LQDFIYSGVSLKQLWNAYFAFTMKIEEGSKKFEFQRIKSRDLSRSVNDKWWSTFQQNKTSKKIFLDFALFCSTFAFLFLKYCQVLDAYLGVTERACIRWKKCFLFFVSLKSATKNLTLRLLHSVFSVLQIS